MAIHEEDARPGVCISLMHNRKMKSTVLYRDFFMGIAIGVHAHVNHVNNCTLKSCIIVVLQYFGKGGKLSQSVLL